MSLARFSLVKLFRALGEMGYKVGLGKIGIIKKFYYSILE